MKTFENFEGFNNWVKKIIDKTSIKSKEDIARQVYKDSEKYIYIDTKTMYDSGELSNFKDGYVLIKAPQVRWLYYTTWIKGHKNAQAVPQWFEATKNENMKNYINIYYKNFKNEKR